MHEICSIVDSDSERHKRALRWSITQTCTFRRWRKLSGRFAIKVNLRYTDKFDYIEIFICI